MIGSILELPFLERAPLDLLGFAGDRATIDPDYAGFGWARLGQLWLDEGGIASVDGGTDPVEGALVLALHGADDGEVLPGDVELEFALGNSVASVLLSAFLDRWLPRLPEAGAIVLAMCNPHHARLPARARPLYYALGPVDAWCDPPDDRLRLTAARWLRAEEPAR